MTEPTVIPTDTDPAMPPAEPHEPEPTEAQPTAEVPVALAPQERQARAEQALAMTQTRIRELGEALATIEPRRVEFAERERQAASAADLLARTLAVQPSLVNAAQARLLVVAGTPAEAGAQQALAAAREQAERLAREEAESRSVLAATRAAVAQALVEIDTEAQHAEAERSQLAGLVIHLRNEVADARRAMGEELLVAAQDRADALQAELEAAEARLAEAKPAQEQHQAEVADALAAYPDAHEQARQSGMLPHPVTRVEQALEARLAFLRTLQRVTTGGGMEVDAIANLPLWPVLADQRGFPYALGGGHAAYWKERIQSASVWLESFKQHYTTQR